MIAMDKAGFLDTVGWKRVREPRRCVKAARAIVGAAAGAAGAIVQEVDWDRSPEKKMRRIRQPRTLVVTSDFS